MSGTIPRIDLQAQENAGGHTIARHVARDVLWLSGRLALEPSIPLASSFADLPSAEANVTAAVQANLVAIQTWLGQGSRAVQSFDHDAGAVVGYGLVRGVAAVIFMTKLRLVLRRMPGPQNFFVLTAFPCL